MNNVEPDPSVASGHTRLEWPEKEARSKLHSGLSFTSNHFLGHLRTSQDVPAAEAVYKVPVSQSSRSKMSWDILGHPETSQDIPAVEAV